MKSRSTICWTIKSCGLLGQGGCVIQGSCESTRFRYNRHPDHWRRRIHRAALPRTTPLALPYIRADRPRQAVQLHTNHDHSRQLLTSIPRRLPRLYPVYARFEIPAAFRGRRPHRGPKRRLSCPSNQYFHPVTLITSAYILETRNGLSQLISQSFAFSHISILAAEEG